jgi:hypothetical protein
MSAGPSRAKNGLSPLQTAPLFDHRVGDGEQIGGHGLAECLSVLTLTPGRSAGLAPLRILAAIDADLADAIT